MDKRFEKPHSHPRWWWDGTYIPACFGCVHFRGASNGKVRCEAFPDGIPRELTLKGVKHDTPFPGDNGIRFEKVEE